MKKKWIGFLIVIFLFACGNNDTSSNSVAKAERKVDGKKIYTQYCVSCHGLYGNMGMSGAFDLTQTKLSVEEKIQVITNGRNLMTPFKSLLSEKQIEAVAKYTENLKK